MKIADIIDKNLLEYATKAHKIMKIITLLIIFLIGISCSNKTKKNQEKVEIEKEINYSVIINQLERMVKNDQQIQFAHLLNETLTVRDSLFNLQNQIFKANTDSLKVLFNKYGFLGFDKVGKKGSKNFWLLVQHADHDISFQEEVLKSMKVEVEKENTDNSNFAYLTDRVLKNRGEKQLYGTQLKYLEGFWIIPQPMIDSLNVNERRKEIGLPTIEDYLNSSMQLHYEMNKETYKNNGLSGPKKYESKVYK